MLVGSAFHYMSQEKLQERVAKETWDFQMIENELKSDDRKFSYDVPNIRKNKFSNLLQSVYFEMLMQ